ncbi:GFA family protein [Aliiroseovarius lamellibrachiae]|uniref:GFA family protein n=1 Tax=Aliiroseovarius lamellibrachiae TaxID=1924933 RepID=UPI003CCE8701
MTQDQHHGSCHCGAVEFEVVLSAGLTSAVRCNCSYCSRRGTIAVTAQVGDLTITKGANHIRDVPMEHKGRKTLVLSNLWDLHPSSAPLEPE